MVKKPPPNLKKNHITGSHHSSTLSPQPLQSERSFLHDKVQEKMKAKSPDKREKEFVTLPEVKGAEGQLRERERRERGEREREKERQLNQKTRQTTQSRRNFNDLLFL